MARVGHEGTHITVIGAATFNVGDRQPSRVIENESSQESPQESLKADSFFPEGEPKPVKPTISNTDLVNLAKWLTSEYTSSGDVNSASLGEDVADITVDVEFDAKEVCATIFKAEPSPVCVVDLALREQITDGGVKEGNPPHKRVPLDFMLKKLGPIWPNKFRVVDGKVEYIARNKPRLQ